MRAPVKGRGPASTCTRHAVDPEGLGSRHKRQRYADSVTDRDVAFDEMRDVLEGAGLVETYVDQDGMDAMRLTANGTRLARQIAMSSEDEQDALLAALVEATAKDDS